VTLTPSAWLTAFATAGATAGRAVSPSPWTSIESGISSIVWVKRRGIAENAARELAPVHRLLLNKYYVDEIYDAAIVQPIRVASQEGLWRGFDVKIIDGAVNGAATIVNSSATVLRRLQTGSVKTYAGSVFVGVVAILAYYLWL